MFKNYLRINQTKQFYNQINFKLVSKEIIEKKIRENIKVINELDVQDTDSGCGQFFSITIKTPEFKGKSLIQQHRLINEILKDELKSVHSIMLKTSI